MLAGTAMLKVGRQARQVKSAELVEGPEGPLRAGLTGSV